jgi:ABC-type proline/glycine betaine transport system permease subunit
MDNGHGQRTDIKYEGRVRERRIRERTTATSSMQRLFVSYLFWITVVVLLHLAFMFIRGPSIVNITRSLILIHLLDEWKEEG